MPKAIPFLRRAGLLWALVAANLAGLLLLIFAAFLATRSAPGMAFFHETFVAAGGMAFSQVLLLAIWTAFYDPQWPVRWLAITVILLATDYCVVVEFAALIKWHYENLYGPGPAGAGWADGMAYQLSVTTAGVSLIVAMGLTMFLHASCWPLRAMLGWRLVFANDQGGPEAPRQFSILQFGAWVGFFGVLFFLLRTLLVEEWFLGPLLFCAAGSLAAAVNVLPWFVLLRFKRFGWRQFVLAGLILGGSVALTWLENEVTTLLNWHYPRLMIPILSSQYAAFNFSAAVVAAANVLVLRAFGARLRAFGAKLAPAIIENAAQVFSPIS